MIDVLNSQYHFLYHAVLRSNSVERHSEKGRKTPKISRFRVFSWKGRSKKIPGITGILPFPSARRDPWRRDRDNRRKPRRRECILPGGSTVPRAGACRNRFFTVAWSQPLMIPRKAFGRNLLYVVQYFCRFDYSAKWEFLQDRRYFLEADCNTSETFSVWMRCLLHRTTDNHNSLVLMLINLPLCQRKPCTYRIPWPWLNKLIKKRDDLQYFFHQLID